MTRNESNNNNTSSSSSSRNTLFDQDFTIVDTSKNFKCINNVKHKLFNRDIPLDVCSLKLNKLLAESTTTTKNSSSSRKLRKQVRTKFRTFRRARDIVHSICALYDNSLPDLGISAIYECICDPKSLTIFLYDASSSTDNDNHAVSSGSSVYGDEDDLENVEKSVEQPKSIFHALFSSTDEDDEEDEEEEDEEDEDDDEEELKNYSKGVGSFIKTSSESESCVMRRNVKRFVACCTLKRVSTVVNSEIETVLDLELLCVQKRYRGLGLGDFLIKLIKNCQLVGNYDAIVTSSDFDAVSFYEKYSFSKDLILNSKYASIGDSWTNTTRMCYVPPYCKLILNDTNEKSGGGGTTNRESYNMSNYYDYIVQLEDIERDYKRWQKAAINSYQYHTQVFMKLKNDVISLTAKLINRNDSIEELKLENEILKRKLKFYELKSDEL